VPCVQTPSRHDRFTDAEVIALFGPAKLTLIAAAASILPLEPAVVLPLQYSSQRRRRPGRGERRWGELLAAEPEGRQHGVAVLVDPWQYNTPVSFVAHCK
jgi:hypothetical protein